MHGPIHIIPKDYGYDASLGGDEALPNDVAERDDGSQIQRIKKSCGMTVLGTRYSMLVNLEIE